MTEFEAVRRMLDEIAADHRQQVDKLRCENDRLRKLAQWASSLLTGIMPYVDYSRCTALEAVAAWKVEASKLEIEATE